MDELLFWLGTGAAQKGAGSKPTARPAPPGNGRFLSQPTMKLLRQPQTDHPMSRPPLHQGKASNASPKGNPDNQAGNGGKGDGHGDTTGQTWNANLLARFNDGPLMNGEMTYHGTDDPRTCHARVLRARPGLL